MQSLRAGPVQHDLEFVLILFARPVQDDTILAGMYVSIGVMLGFYFLDDVRRRVREDVDVA